MTWLTVAGCLSAAAGLLWWLIWDHRATYGPVIHGNARWRREAPLRAARQAEREALAALTTADRFPEPMQIVNTAPPTRAELTAGVAPPGYAVGGYIE